MSRQTPDRHPGPSEDAALGRLVREAWTEGPPAPSPEFLIQALRPELARIDLDVAERPSFGRTWARIRAAFGPVPMAALAATGMLALLFVGPEVFSPASDAVAAAGLSLRNVQSPGAIYDLSAEDAPLMIFEAEDGSTIIWILDNPAEDGPAERTTEGLLDGEEAG